MGSSTGGPQTLEAFLTELPKNTDPDEFVLKYGKEELLKRVDNALYEAKESGRDRVIVDM